MSRHKVLALEERMQLVNQIEDKRFPMRRIGTHHGISGEIPIDGRRASREWRVRIGVCEAVRVLAPSVRIVSVSRRDRALLGQATLSIRFDGETAAKGLPLLGPHAPICPAHVKTHWLMALDRDRPRGVFLVDGTVVEAVVRLPASIRSPARIRILLKAALYTTR